MNGLPPAGDIALALVIVGALFLLRFVLAVRRIRAGDETRPKTALFEDLGQASRPSGFGPANEPERRWAMRQFYVGAVFSAGGLLLAAWLVVASVLGPLLDRGFPG